MKRLLGAVLAGFVALTWAVPVLAAGEVLAHTVLLFIAAIVPLLTAVISFLGFGAVVVAGWRTVRGVSTSTLFRPTTAPVAR